MSKRYTLAGAALVAAFIAGPAFADGTPGQTPVQGPAPLSAQPHHSSPHHAATCQHGQTAHHGRTDCIVPFAPITGRVQYTPPPAVFQPPAPAPQAMNIDLASFNGGVGSGVGSGFYGGGGTIVLNNSARFSGVLSHRASVLTFRHRGGGGGKPPHSPCGSCGGGHNSGGH